MARSKVVLNHSEIGQMLRAEGSYSGVRDELHRRADPVLAAAQAAAPVASGAYRDSLAVVDDTTDRAVVRVVATVPYAGVVEAHTGTLARALDAAGGA